jgi:rare lipoprotein A (peptidoglycan hydrolase)
MKNQLIMNMNFDIKKITAFFCLFLGACQTTDSREINSNTVVTSWYQSGHRTASGQRFDPNGLSAAHRTLPFGTKLKLTNPNNGKSIIVTVNDRGPFIRGTGLDVSRGAAHQLGFIGKGKTKLKMQVLR